MLFENTKQWIIFVTVENFLTFYSKPTHRSLQSKSHSWGGDGFNILLPQRELVSDGRYEFNQNKIST